MRRTERSACLFAPAQRLCELAAVELGLLQKIGCSGMIAVEREHCVQQWSAQSAARLRPVRSLRAQKGREHAIATDEIFVEEQHRRQGSREVVDIRLPALQVDRVIGDAA